MADTQPERGSEPSPATARWQTERGGRRRRAHLCVVSGQRRRDSSSLQRLRSDRHPVAPPPGAGRRADWPDGDLLAGEGRGPGRSPRRLWPASTLSNTCSGVSFCAIRGTSESRAACGLRTRRLYSSPGPWTRILPRCTKLVKRHRQHRNAESVRGIGCGRGQPGQPFH